MKTIINEDTFNRWQKLAGIQSLNENENVKEGFLDKLKNIFSKTEYTMTGKNEEYGYAYFSDDEGNKYIGMTILDMRPDPGYRTKETKLWAIEDEAKIQQAVKNEKAQNRQYQGTQRDAASSLDGEHIMDKGDYYPEPFKVVNKSTF
jgi:hypothetical protein